MWEKAHFKKNIGGEQEIGKVLVKTRRKPGSGNCEEAAGCLEFQQTRLRASSQFSRLSSCNPFMNTLLRNIISASILMIPCGRCWACSRAPTLSRQETRNITQLSTSEPVWRPDTTTGVIKGGNFGTYFGAALHSLGPTVPCDWSSWVANVWPVVRKSECPFIASNSEICPTLLPTFDEMIAADCWIGQLFLLKVWQVHNYIRVTEIFHRVGSLCGMR